MPFKIDATVFIPKDKINSDLLRFMGFTEKEIEYFYLRIQEPEDIERNKRMMQSGEIKFNEYEEVK